MIRHTRIPHLLLQPTAFTQVCLCGSTTFRFGMPLCPQYVWEETPTTVKIVVAAPGLTKAKSDLLICDTFLRLNFAPYLLQLDLLHPINDSNFTATYGAGSLTCHLNKVRRQLVLLFVSITTPGSSATTLLQSRPRAWGQLTAEGRKQELQDRRCQSQQRLELRLQQAKLARLEQQQAADKYATNLAYLAHAT